MLQIPLNHDYQLREIVVALGEKDLSSYFSKSNDTTLVKVLMEKGNYGKTYIHTCDIILDEEKEVPFFFLQEEITDSMYFSKN